MFTRIVWDFLRLRRNLRMAPADLKEMQDKELRRMVRHAYENVRFYRRKFDDHGVRPDDVTTMADLAKIPITTKIEIQENLDQTFAVDPADGGFIKRETSGSTGLPLTLIVSRNTTTLERALWARTYMECGLKVSDILLHLTDPCNFQRKPNWYQRLGLMRREFISIFDTPERQVELLEAKRPNAIRGYPSCLVLMGNALRQRQTSTKPRLTFTVSEPLDREDRKFINDAFQTETFDAYASEEFGPIAWECNSHDGYHINVDNVVLEFVKDGEPVAPGERGRIVCTSLIHEAMPFIRYDIGDVGVLSDERCTCGRTLPLMEIIEGRRDDFLTTLDGRLISPRVFTPFPFDGISGIRQFKVTQDSLTKLIIELVTDERFPKDPKGLRVPERRLKALLGQAVSIEFRLVDSISKDSSGKLRKIVSKVPADNARAL